MPGASVFTRMPMRANSRASGSIMPTTPPFDAEYAAWPIWPSNAAIDAVLTMTPRSPSAFASFDCMRKAASLDTRNEPTRLMAIVRAKKSPAIGPSRPSARAAPMTPAQFTASVMPPMRSLARSSADCTAVSSATSAATKEARSPRSRALVSPCSAFRSRRAAWPPAAMTRSAVASPSPDAPPVITAFALLRSTSISPLPGPWFDSRRSRHLNRHGHRFAAANAQRCDAATAAPPAAARVSG